MEQPSAGELAAETIRVLAIHSSADGDLTRHSDAISADARRNAAWLETWQQTLENDPGGNIYQHPAFVINDLLGKPVSRQRPLLVFTVEDHQHRTLMAILAPIDVEHTLLFGYLPTLRLPGYRLCGGRFIGCQDEPLRQTFLQVVAPVLDEFGARFLLFEDLEDHRPLWQLLDGRRSDRLRRFLPAPGQVKHRIMFGEDAQAYWSTWSKSRRKSFRNRLNRLAEVRTVRITEVGDVAGFLEAAHRISAKSWQARIYGVRVRNDRREQRLLAGLASLGFLRCYLLLVDDEPIAFEVGYQYRGYMHGAEAGFDLDHARQSPGNVLMYLEIMDLIAHRTPAVYDFGEGDAPYKQTFSTHTTFSANVWLMRPGLRSRALAALMTCNRVLEHGVHRLLERLHIKTMARNLYRRLGLGKDAGDDR